MSSSNFANSHNVLQDNTFVTATNYYASGPSNRRGFDLLYHNIAADAMHNSDERCDAPKCHPETRTAVQEEILSWIDGGDDDVQPKKILWLTGPAGSGKTAIAGSIAEMCDDRGLLAGSFFFSSFSGSESRRSKRCVVATLAYGLVQHDGLQPLQGPILSTIERDPSIFKKRLKDQCKTLLLKSFHNPRGELVQSSLPKVIVIDGLDEVEAAGSRQLDPHAARMANEEDQVEILSALLQAANDAHFPFRILIISRPERAIRDFFTNKATTVFREVFLDEKYDPDSDIALYLRSKFAELRRRYKLPPSWPTEEVIQALVERASGQFIYASTVIRFIFQHGNVPPHERLSCVLELRSQDSSLNPLASLDALYTHILMSSPDPILSSRWLGAMDSSLSGCSSMFTKQFLQDYPGQADYLLENLTSLIHIPAFEDGHSPFRIYHKSLIDFLNSDRCGQVLHEAFLEADGDFDRRCVQVFKAKSSVLPLAEPEWRSFIREFVAAINRSYSAPHYPSSEHDLANCDVVWWVHAIVVACSADIEPQWKTAITLSTLFSGAHFNCGIADKLGDCKQSCKHWRRAILQASTMLGWITSSTPLAFLRERMVGRLSYPFYSWDVAVYFEPPKMCSDRKSAYLPLQTQTFSEVRKEDYEALCRLADTMYSRLPPDWEGRFQEELDGGRTVHDALRSAIDGIKRDLGLDIKDIDWEDAWPRQVQAYMRERRGSGATS